jgi:hypothetical protein
MWTHYGRAWNSVFNLTRNGRRASTHCALGSLRFVNAPAKRMAVLLGSLFVLAIAIPLIPIPNEWLYAGRIVSSVSFVSLPILAIYYLGMLGWTWRVALVVLIVSASAFVALTFTARGLTEPPVAVAIVGAILQLGVLAWASSLGILIATAIRDKNLLLPICIVLATVDIIAVLAPIGTVKRAMETETGRTVFETISFKVPQFGSATPAAQIGPADFLFLSMFFAAIHRFGMRSRETLFAIIPGLLIYLGIVLFFGQFSVFGIPLRALPALVPIGILVIAINIREFKFSREEKIMTWTLFLICAAAIWASFALTKTQAIEKQTNESAPRSQPE